MFVYVHPPPQLQGHGWRNQRWIHDPKWSSGNETQSGLFFWMMEKLRQDHLPTSSLSNRIVSLQTEIDTQQEAEKSGRRKIFSRSLRASISQFQPFAKVWLPAYLQILKHIPWFLTAFSFCQLQYSLFAPKVKVKSLSHVWLYATPWTVCSPPGSSIHGILQARILEWGAISFSRGCSRPRDRTQVSCIPGRRFNLWATREAKYYARAQKM